MIPVNTEREGIMIMAYLFSSWANNNDPDKIEMIRFNLINSKASCCMKTLKLCPVQVDLYEGEKRA